jgi:hypothetical protein
MKAYKATYNMKCQSITFEIGKTYTHDGELIFCEKGFHFCKDPRNTLKYYNCTKDFELMEIDAIGVIYDAYNKSITNEFSVIRVVPKEEYPELLGITLDSNNNIIKKVLKNGDTFLFEYDQNKNMTKKVYPNGDIYLYEYDQNNKLIKRVYPNGDIYLLCDYNYNDYIKQE